MTTTQPPFLYRRSLSAWYLSCVLRSGCLLTFLECHRFCHFCQGIERWRQTTRLAHNTVNNLRVLI